MSGANLFFKKKMRLAHLGLKDVSESNNFLFKRPVSFASGGHSPVFHSKDFGECPPEAHQIIFPFPLVVFLFLLKRKEETKERER